MKAEVSTSQQSSLAKPLAPEDVRCGDYVAALNVVHEFPSFFWSCEGTGVAPQEPVRLRCRAPDGGTPLRIKAICLPFVFIKTRTGGAGTIDLRQVQLVRLDAAYAKQVWKELRKQSAQSSRSTLRLLRPE